MKVKSRYEFGDVLGEGAFATVYLGTRRPDGLRVAIKVLHGASQDAYERFVREARQLKALQGCENVVRLLDDGWLQHAPPYIVLEFCERGSVRSWLHGPRTMAEALKIASDAARGLAAIHIGGGFHRDLKPENILLTMDRKGTLRAKIADFGLARVDFGAAGSRLTRSPGGTPGYMAPELSWHAAFNSACDIWSLGAVFHELFTGAPGDGDTAELRRSPAQLRTLVLAMTSGDPRQRPCASAIVAALDDYIRNGRAARDAEHWAAAPKAHMRAAARAPASPSGDWLAPLLLAVGGVAAIALLAKASGSRA